MKCELRLKEKGIGLVKIWGQDIPSFKKNTHRCTGPEWDPRGWRKVGVAEAGRERRSREAVSASAGPRGQGAELSSSLNVGAVLNEVER